MTGQALLVRPHGLPRHTYWLTSPDFELILGKSEKFPPVLVHLHSAYPHTVGIDWALDLMEALLRHEMFAGAYRAERVAHRPVCGLSGLGATADGAR